MLRVANRTGKTMGARSMEFTILLVHLEADRRRCGSRDAAVGLQRRESPKIAQDLLVVEGAAGDWRQVRAADLDGGIGEDVWLAPFHRTAHLEMVRGFALDQCHRPERGGGDAVLALYFGDG